MILCHIEAQAQGALIVAVLDEERNPASTGGEAGFKLVRRSGEVLGDDGFIVCHEERAIGQGDVLSGSS